MLKAVITCYSTCPAYTMPKIHLLKQKSSLLKQTTKSLSVPPIAYSHGPGVNGLSRAKSQMPGAIFSGCFRKLSAISPSLALSHSSCEQMIDRILTFQVQVAEVRCPVWQLLQKAVRYIASVGV